VEDPIMAMDIRKKHIGLDIAPTGDPLIDMWERQIAAGEVPDLDACESPNIREHDKKIREEARRHYMETGEKIYIPPVPVTIDQIESLRDKVGLPDFDVDTYQSEPNPFTNGAMVGVARDDFEDSLRDMSPAAFDQFINTAGLIKK